MVRPANPTNRVHDRSRAYAVDSLATKLTASSRDILKNRASILTLLYSLSKDAGNNKENQVIVDLHLDRYQEVTV